MSRACSDPKNAGKRSHLLDHRMAPVGPVDREGWQPRECQDCGSKDRINRTALSDIFRR